MRAVGDDVGLRLSDVGAQPGGGLDANQRLLRPVEKGIAPLDGGCRPLHRIKRSRLVTDQDAVGRTCRWRRLESRLPGSGVGAEKAQAHARVASRFCRVAHRLRPVFVVTNGQESFVIEQPGAACVSVDVGRVTYVIPRSLEPAHEIDLPGQESSVTRAPIRPIERDLHRTRGRGQRRGSVAVVVVQAFAGGVVVRIIVVGLVGGHALLIQQIAAPAVVADDEADVIVVSLRVRQQNEIDAGRPGGRDDECERGRPPALNQPGARVSRAGRLLIPLQRCNPLHETAAFSLVPADPVDVHREGLGRVDGHEERDRFTFVDARRRGISLDLLVHVVAERVKLPLVAAWPLILENDRIVRR